MDHEYEKKSRRRKIHWTQLWGKLSHFIVHPNFKKQCFPSLPSYGTIICFSVYHLVAVHTIVHCVCCLSHDNSAVTWIDRKFAVQFIWSIWNLTMIQNYCNTNIYSITHPNTRWHWIRVIHVKHVHRNAGSSYTIFRSVPHFSAICMTDTYSKILLLYEKLKIYAYGFLYGISNHMHHQYRTIKQQQAVDD